MSSTMHAISVKQYGPTDKLAPEAISRPSPAANEVLIKIHYAGVNPIDWKLLTGHYKDFMPITFPHVPGIDVSGTIEEVGPGVTTFKKGQAVFGLAKGAYAEYALANENDISLKPEKISFETAATLPVGALTAWQMVADADVDVGHTVLVQGAAGGVGLFAVQFVKLKGAKVIGSSSAANTTYVTSIGADKALDYKSPTFDADAKGVDIVLDTVGGETLEKSYSLVKKGGLVVTVAGMPSEEKAKALGIRVKGSGRGLAASLDTIADLIVEGKVKAQIGKIFPLAETKAALELSQSGHGRGRILIKIAG